MLSGADSDPQLMEAYRLLVTKVSELGVMHFSFICDAIDICFPFLSFTLLLYDFPLLCPLSLSLSISLGLSC